MSQVEIRRQLEFANLDDIIRDIKHLHQHGYRQAGAWNLAQVAAHVADWMQFPMDGFPRAALPVRMMLWVVKQTMAKGQLRKILSTKSMPAGNPTLRETVHPEGEDEAAQVERLEGIARRLDQSQGPYHPSPLFGNLERDRLIQLQLIHAAHHLSFLIPDQDGHPPNSTA